MVIFTQNQILTILIVLDSERNHECIEFTKMCFYINFFNF